MNIAKLFARIAVAISFLSASADRFGFWPESVSAWGNWGAFVEYVQVLNPWAHGSLLQVVAVVATGCEVIFGVCLLLGLFLKPVSWLSGLLLLSFALAMAVAPGVGIKPVFDYSVLPCAAASFLLAMLPAGKWELDNLLHRGRA